MQSSTDPGAISSQQDFTRRPGKWRAWNRKVHIYSGLYLWFFVGLFTFTGLLLNHPEWRFAEFWTNRRQSAVEKPIARSPIAGGDLALARDLMQQLGLRGEVEWTKAPAARPSRFEFRVSRPGTICEVNADLEANKASVKQIELNGWGVAHVLHAFTGVRRDDARNNRDWGLTKMWVFAMDATAAGLVIMVLSSLVMWYDESRRRAAGAVVLLSGALLCGFFVFGLLWLY
jgi:hypothetical protein